MTLAQQSRREALAKRVYCACATTEGTALRVADFIIAEQERREGPLVKCIEENALALACSGNGNPVNVARIRNVLSAYRAIDSPPQRTVEQIAADVVDSADVGPASPRPEERLTVPRRFVVELAAALKRGKE